MRVPGLHGTLESSWVGPYQVVKVVSRVTYFVRKVGGGSDKLVHINNLKFYRARPKSVSSVCIVAEETGDMEEVLSKSSVLGEEKCNGYVQANVDKLLADCDECFSDKPGLCLVGVCSIELEAGAEVVSLPPYQIPQKLKPLVSEEVQKLVDNGVIVPSNSKWCSPIVPVRNPDGSIRVCVDFRKLNEKTPINRYYLPTLEELVESVGNSSVLSTLDLSSGFHQIPMDESSSELTTFVSPLGKFRYKRMPFGLKNAPAVFQRVMEEFLEPVKKFCGVYIDDTIVYSDGWSNHMRDLKCVLECINSAGVTVKRKKSVFGKKRLKYLGHMVGEGTVAVPENRVLAFKEYGKPKTKRQLRTFLGALGYYRRFIPGFARSAAILTPSTALSAPKLVDWSEEMSEAFTF